jgi:hypothetical protein
MLDTHDFKRLPRPPVSLETTRALFGIGERGGHDHRNSAILPAAADAFTSAALPSNGSTER